MSVMSAENRAEALRLRNKGWTYLQIGQRFGPDRSIDAQKSIGRRLLNYEQALVEAREWKARNHDHCLASNRRYRYEHRGVCAECNGRMCQDEDGVCLDCRVLGKEANYRAIELMWEDGLTFPQIMEALGWTKGHVSVVMDRMRKEGWNLPYRRRTYGGRPLPQSVAA